MTWRSLILTAALAPLLLPLGLRAQGIVYRVEVGTDSTAGVFRARAEFPVPPGHDTLLVALPAWSPGSYEIQDYARYVHGFNASTMDGQPLFWDKLDKGTWRIATRGATRVVAQFLTDPDSMALELSRAGADFAYFNGTNLFLYPVGAGFDFPSDLYLDVPAGWRIATGLASAGERGHYRAASYHDLVDSPTFLGRFAEDSVMADGRPIRFAIWPDTALTPALWDSVADALRRIVVTQNRIMGGPPYDAYTVLLLAPPAEMDWAGGLEHRNAQLDAMSLAFFATDRRRGVLGEFTRPLLSHEFFHLWNVKRARPAAMWPYDYAHPQYTPLLWWSEGVTDYYADVTLARGGLWSVDRFVASMSEDAAQVEDAAETVSAEDASIDTWIKPVWVDEEQYYYWKGALLGLMLDIRIRESTGNAHSLDDVMRELLASSWGKGRGFTTQDLLGIVRTWYPGVDEFYRRYIQGREPLPYTEVLARGGIAVEQQETRIPMVGVSSEKDQDGGALIASVAPGSLAASVGIQPGDVLLRVGDVTTSGPMWPIAFRVRYANGEGRQVPVVFRHAGQVMTSTATIRVRTVRTVGLRRDLDASAAAKAILAGITGQ
ncbi:MAG TPA: PDZ domain-containing protein [Gemmatimonadales bacterium]|nr:PDZ domain-containing protein [Gemmatimonadales bacterium]